MVDISELQDRIARFNTARDWNRFHTTKDLLLALVSEVGELADCYRWLSDHEIKELHETPSKKQEISHELADIFMFLMMLSKNADIDLSSAVLEKLERNETRFPPSSIKSKHTNKLVKRADHASCD